jgi:hypothetical protein
MKIDENWQKSMKIVTITSTPGPGDTYSRASFFILAYPSQARLCDAKLKFSNSFSIAICGKQIWRQAAIQDLGKDKTSSKKVKPICKY